MRKFVPALLLQAACLTSHVVAAASQKTAMSRARNQAKLDGANKGSQLKQNEAALTLKVRSSARFGFYAPDAAHTVQNLLAAVHLHQHGVKAEGAQRQQAPKADVCRCALQYGLAPLVLC